MFTSPCPQPADGREVWPTNMQLSCLQLDIKKSILFLSSSVSITDISGLILSSHSFHKHLLSCYCVPDMTQEEMEKTPCLPLKEYPALTSEVGLSLLLWERG